VGVPGGIPGDHHCIRVRILRISRYSLFDRTQTLLVEVLKVNHTYTVLDNNGNVELAIAAPEVRNMEFGHKSSLNDSVMIQ
jgi:hypothetical protein